MRRKMKGYFQPVEGAPPPLLIQIKRRVKFSEVDVMGIAWHGRYPAYFEEGWAELGRHCGLSYRDFHDANIHAPIVQLHIDYHRPLYLDEEFTITASFIWSEGARLHTEYSLIKEDGKFASTGYTIQMFVDGITKEACLISPEILERCRSRWQAGEFSCLT
ncbi:MAG: acyl-CoA thioesterase [bacterium]